MSNERREYQRVSFKHSARLIKDGQTLDCQIIDLSIHGVLLRPDEELPSSIDSSFLLEISLDNEVAGINMTIKLAHRNPDSLGFVCEKIDIDSISHLRKVVEFNSGDSARLDRDFETLCQSNL